MAQETGLSNVSRKPLPGQGEAASFVFDAHVLRDTLGTHHVVRQISLRTVQESLAHADLESTSIYVQLAREVMNK